MKPQNNVPKIQADAGSRFKRISFYLFVFIMYCPFISVFSQNLAINTDGTSAETGVMLDIKQPTPKATTASAQTFFQIKSFDADADALKLRLGFKTDATQTNRYVSSFTRLLGKTLLLWFYILLQINTSLTVQ